MNIEKNLNRAGAPGLTEGGLEARSSFDDDWTLVKKKARRNRNPKTRKVVTECSSPRELLTILALISIVPLDIFPTKKNGNFVVKMTNNMLGTFDSEIYRKKMAQKTSM